MVTRILYFAYGCLAYALFLATFLYAVAFVGGALHSQILCDLNGVCVFVAESHIAFS